MKLYAYKTGDVPKLAGFLKIGETTRTIKSRVKQQGREIPIKKNIVWEETLVANRINVDKMIIQFLEKQGCEVIRFEETGEQSEWVKCEKEDIEFAFEKIKEQIRSEDKRKDLEQKFYEELRNWYFWATEETKNPDYSLRIIIRLLLCFFLREKGLIPVCLFEENFIKENLKEDEYRYYKAIIRNLFFYSLNTPHDKRKELEGKNLIKNYGTVKKQFHEKIPFLNGGLFTEHPGDDIPLNDDYFFTAPRTRTLKELDGKFPVAGIVYILSQYKYTLDETENSELIDPEFIGKMFECLLACIDADNKKNRRKVTGSYYTPREIVDYMVNEALDAALRTADNGQQTAADAGIEQLLSLKIFDPACGSGAFPCGIMNVIMKRLDPQDKFTQAERYQAKLKILQNVIYGVDIQPVAVQIAMFRMFLSLVQETRPTNSNNAADNFGIDALPNLETKFVCANTLIGRKKRKQGHLELPLIKTTVKQLLSTRRQHIMESDPQKKRDLQEADDALRKILGIALKDAGDLSHKTAEMMIEWNPYDQTLSAPFFDAFWMFGIEKFDIVIGNPPYLMEGRIPKKAFAHVPYYQGKMDLWYSFACIGIDIIKENGILSFIATNNWFTNSGASILRNKILSETTLKSVVDFGALMVFENSSIQTMVMLLEKHKRDSYQFDYRRITTAKPNQEHIKKILKRTPGTGLQYLQPVIVISALKDKFLVFSDTSAEAILDKIKKKKNFTLNKKSEIAQGIVPNPDVVTTKNIQRIPKGRITAENIHVGDGVFVIEKGTFAKLSATEKKYVKPCYEPHLCERYYLGHNKKEIIYITKKNYKGDCPSLILHLSKYKEIMEQRRENQQKKLSFYHLHWARMSSFFAKGGKILSVRKCRQPVFIYTEEEAYMMMSFNIIRSKRVNLKYLTAFLNSKLIAFWLRHRGKMQEPNYQIDKVPLLEIPIFVPDADTQDRIIRHADKILSAKQNNPQADTSKLEEQIDDFLYELYGLTDEEIKIVEGE